MSTLDTAKARAIKLLESLFARALRLDPTASDKLRAMEGRTVALHISEPAMQLTLRVQDSALRFVDEKDEPSQAHLQLKTSASSLLSLAVNQLLGESHLIGKMHINGDAELAQTLQKLAQSFSPDWDELFSQALGDVLGYQAATGARKVGNWLKRSAQQFVQSTAAYLQDESQQIVDRITLEDWLDAVDDLRDGVERASRRLERLQQTSLRA